MKLSLLTMVLVLFTGAASFANNANCSSRSNAGMFASTAVTNGTSSSGGQTSSAIK